MRRFDSSKDGLISYREFIRHFKQMSRTQTRTDVAEATLDELLRRIMATHGLPAMSALQAEFKAVDSDGSGQLTATELRRALAKWGADITAKDARVGALHSLTMCVYVCVCVCVYASGVLKASASECTCSHHFLIPLLVLCCGGTTHCCCFPPPLRTTHTHTHTHTHTDPLGWRHKPT